MPRRKKKTVDIGEKLVVIPNVDKGNWCEKNKKGQSPGYLPHPFRILALGNVGRGKTNTLKNIFLKHQAGDRKFQRLYVCTCDLESNEWDDVEPDELTDQLFSPRDFDDKYKTCLVIDDYEFTKMTSDDQKKLSTLMRYVGSHKNVSIMLSFQSFFDCPSIARKCANAFVLYPPNNKSEIPIIEKRVGLDEGVLKSLFRELCKEPYDSIMVDRTINSEYPIRKNVYQVVDVDSDSEDES